MRRVRRFPIILAALVAAAAGCSSGGGRHALPASGTCLAWVSGTPSGTAPPTGSAAAAGSPESGGSPAAAPGPPSPATADSPLAGVALPCLDGTGSVTLTGLGRPAIVNLWASWCLPCLSEVPAFQAYAARAGGSVAVIGVISGDTRSRASSFLDDKKVSYPNLFDEHGRLLAAVGRTGLPVTLFVAPDGTVRHVYNSTALDLSAITRLAHTYLGVGQ